MSSSDVPKLVHDVAPRESRDKIYLLLAFAGGVAGGIFLKVAGTHPFIAAGFSAGVLVLYAVLTYGTTAQRLEPEVIGDNAYYLGFLFTLTSLSVTLYFVVEADADQRADLIPEVISGFGVALVSTIMGVFIRVLMMQFRVDLVAREKETRVELDEAIRRFRAELGQSTQRLKLFAVESLQHAAERETAILLATDELLKAAHSSLSNTVRGLQSETARIHRDQLTATLDTMRASIKMASDAALDQMRTSFSEMGKIAGDLHTINEITRNAVEQANANLQQRTGEMADHADALACRIRTVTESMETAGNDMGKGIRLVSLDLQKSFEGYRRQLDDGWKVLETDPAATSRKVFEILVGRLVAGGRSLAEAEVLARKLIEKARQQPATSTSQRAGPAQEQPLILRGGSPAVPPGKPA